VWIRRSWGGSVRPRACLLVEMELISAWLAGGMADLDACLDMDAFSASVEERDDSALRGKPVIVGAPFTQRGVVCAASYEARKFGVHSTMPSATAGRLRPKGIFVRPRMEVYKDESR
jgi:hypothetical protein